MIAIFINIGSKKKLWERVGGYFCRYFECLYYVCLLKKSRITPSPIPPRFRHHVFFFSMYSTRPIAIQWTKRDNSNTSRTDRVHVGEGTIWYCFYNCGEDAQSCPPPHQLSWNKPPHNTLFHIEWIKSRLSIKNREPNCCEGPLDLRQHFKPGGFNCVSVQYDKNNYKAHRWNFSGIFSISTLTGFFIICLNFYCGGKRVITFGHIDCFFVVLNNHVSTVLNIWYTTVTSYLQRHST